MLAIHWIAIRRDGTRGLVERMTLRGNDLANAMAHARASFDQVRAAHPDGPPNGFIVLDDQGREIGRYFLPGAFDNRGIKNSRP